MSYDALLFNHELPILILGGWASKEKSEFSSLLRPLTNGKRHAVHYLMHAGSC